MTGFGRGEAFAEDLHVAAEIKAVNNRYLEISTKFSPTLTDFELRSKEIIRGYIERGRIFLSMMDLSPQLKMETIKLNEDLAGALIQHLRNLSAHLNLPGEIGLKDLLPFAEQLQQNGFVHIPPELLDTAESALQNALKNLSNMRRAEGKALKTDLLQRLDKFEEDLAASQNLAQGNTAQRMNKLRERIKTLSGMQDLDPYRLEMEVVFLADKLDIAEEMVRLQSHCQQFRKMIETGSPCGRRLAFLIQEMNRELNTSSAKADLHEMSHLVVEMKEELERMREQAQNVE